MGYKKGILHISAICGKSVFIGLPVENPHGPEGIPVYLLINELKEKMGDERCAFAAVLYAIDFGKGSIVVNKLGDCYMFYLHAGGQNYKYYENLYFPFLDCIEWS